MQTLTERLQRRPPVWAAKDGGTCGATDDDGSQAAVEAARLVGNVRSAMLFTSWAMDRSGAG